MASVTDIFKHIDKNSKFNELEQNEKMKLMWKQIGDSLYNSVLNNKNVLLKRFIQDTSILKTIRNNFLQHFTHLFLRQAKGWKKPGIQFR